MEAAGWRGPRLIAMNLENPKAGALTKISVLGVMGSRKDKRYLPVVRRLAQTLGLIGDASDVALLESLRAPGKREPRPEGRTQDPADFRARAQPGDLLDLALEGALRRLGARAAK